LGGLAAEKIQQSQRRQTGTIAAIDHADAAHPAFAVLPNVLFRKGLVTRF
jgi:hypothetical protein